MRIIGGHDYYDLALSMGRDDQVIFVREKAKFLSNDEAKANGIVWPSLQFNIVCGEDRYAKQISSYYSEEMRNHEFGYVAVEVYFCGKLYRGVCVKDGSSKINCIWNAEQMSEWFSKFGWRMIDRTPNSWDKSAATPLKIDECFGQYEVSESIKEFLIKNRITILYNEPNSLNGRKMVDGRWERLALRWVINGDGLKNYDFYQITDAFTAFQEISMWVGGTLPNLGQPMVEITDDKIKVAKHGFDKWSFRKKVR